MSELEINENEEEQEQNIEKDKKLRGELIDNIQKRIHGIKYFNQKIDGSKKDVHVLKIPLPHDEELRKKVETLVIGYQKIIDKDIQPIIEQDNKKLIPKQYFLDINTLETLFMNPKEITEDKQKLIKLYNIYIKGVSNGKA
jgi:hypothetical protein